jgi:hypothetical protein
MPDDDGFVFLTHAGQPAEIAPPSDVELQRHALFGRGKEVTVSPQQLDGFWKDKVVKLTDTISDAQTSAQPKGFRVDEISFGLAVGAKGGLVFVAEASVEATITVTLRRAS